MNRTGTTKRGPTARWAAPDTIGNAYLESPTLVLILACGRHSIHQPCQGCGRCTTASGGGLRCHECGAEDWGT